MRVALCLHVVHINWLLEHSKKLWCHCKNIEALRVLLLANVRCFYHDTDKATLTSSGHIWTYPGENITNCSICVLPEINGWEIPAESAGVCSDYIGVI